MSDVSLTFDGDRAYVELDRPDKHNGLTIDMLNDLVRVARVIGSPHRHSTSWWSPTRSRCPPNRSAARRSVH